MLVRALLLSLQQGGTVSEFDLVTGLGSWQTVSVRVVDEEQERIERELQEQKEAEEAAEVMGGLTTRFTAGN